MSAGCYVNVSTQHQELFYSNWYYASSFRDLKLRLAKLMYNDETSRVNGLHLINRFFEGSSAILVRKRSRFPENVTLMTDADSWFQDLMKIKAALMDPSSVETRQTPVDSRGTPLDVFYDAVGKLSVKDNLYTRSTFEETMIGHNGPISWNTL